MSDAATAGGGPSSTEAWGRLLVTRSLSRQVFFISSSVSRTMFHACLCLRGALSVLDGLLSCGPAAPPPAARRRRRPPPARALSDNAAQTDAGRCSLLVYGNVFIIFGPFLAHFSRISQLYTGPRALYDMLYT